MKRPLEVSTEVVCPACDGTGFQKRILYSVDGVFAASPPHVIDEVIDLAGGFVVRGTLSEWQRSLSREGVERLLAGMRAGNDHLDL